MDSPPGGGRRPRHRVPRVPPGVRHRQRKYRRSAPASARPPVPKGSPPVVILGNRWRQTLSRFEDYFALWEDHLGISFFGRRWRWLSIRATTSPFSVLILFSRIMVTWGTVLPNTSFRHPPPPPPDSPLGRGSWVLFGGGGGRPRGWKKAADWLPVSCLERPPRPLPRSGGRPAAIEGIVRAAMQESAAVLVHRYTHSPPLPTLAEGVTGSGLGVGLGVGPSRGIMVVVHGCQKIMLKLVPSFVS